MVTLKPTERVIQGSDTILPKDFIPYKTQKEFEVNGERGIYTFIRWINPPDTIVEDTIIDSNWEKSPIVTIVDCQGDIIKQEAVPYKSEYKLDPIDNARFIGYDHSDINEITEDITITAECELKITLHFYNCYGEELETITDYQDLIVYPVLHDTEELTFQGWETPDSEGNVLSICQVNAYTVTFIDHNNNIILVYNVEYGESVTDVPTLDIEDPTKEFVEWQGNYLNVTHDEIVRAIVRDIQCTLTLVKDPIDAPYDLFGAGTYTKGSEVLIYVKKHSGITEPWQFLSWESETWTTSTEYTNIVLRKNLELVAHFDNITHLVKFINTLTGDVISELLVLHYHSALEPNYSAPEGYEFKGWDLDFTQVKKDLEIRTILTTIKHTVKFLDCDGNLFTSRQVAHGENIQGKLPPVSGRIQSWNYSDEAVNSDITIYPTCSNKLIKITYTIKDSRNRTLQTLTEDVGYSPEYWIPDNLAQGCVFDGWQYINSNYEYITATSQNEMPRNLQNDIEFVAQWHTQTYTVTFETCNNEPIVTKEVLYDGSVSFPLVNNILGWDHDGKHITSDQVIHALCETILYHVVFNVNNRLLDMYTREKGATIGQFPEYNPSCAWNWHGWPNEYNPNSVVTEDIIINSVADPVKKTHTFKFNWNVTNEIPEATKLGNYWVVTRTDYADSSYKVPQFITESGYVYTKSADWPSTETGYFLCLNKTFVASRNTEAPTSFNIIWKDWDGTTLKTETVEAGSDATPPANPTRECYTFDSWDGSYTNITSDKIITALYTRNTYTVTYKIKAGSDWEEVYADYFSIKNIPCGNTHQVLSFPDVSGYTAPSVWTYKINSTNATANPGVWKDLKVDTTFYAEYILAVSTVTIRNFITNSSTLEINRNFSTRAWSEIKPELGLDSPYEYKESTSTIWNILSDNTVFTAGAIVDLRTVVAESTIMQGLFTDVSSTDWITIGRLINGCVNADPNLNIAQLFPNQTREIIHTNSERYTFNWTIHLSNLSTSFSANLGDLLYVENIDNDDKNVKTLIKTIVRNKIDYSNTNKVKWEEFLRSILGDPLATITVLNDRKELNASFTIIQATSTTSQIKAARLQYIYAPDFPTYSDWTPFAIVLQLQFKSHLDYVVVDYSNLISGVMSGIVESSTSKQGILLNVTLGQLDSSGHISGNLPCMQDSDWKYILVWNAITNLIANNSSPNISDCTITGLKLRTDENIAMYSTEGCKEKFTHNGVELTNLLPVIDDFSGKSIINIDESSQDTNAWEVTAQ